MPMLNFNIAEYSVSFPSNSPPYIMLYAPNFVGKLIFMPNDAILPPITQNPWTLYYRHDDFHNVIDILRNEKPVWLTVTAIPLLPTSGVIHTLNETVGEGE